MADTFLEIGRGRLESVTLHFDLDMDLVKGHVDGGTVTECCHQINLVVDAMLQALLRAKFKGLKDITIFSHPDPDGSTEELARNLAKFINQQENTLNSLSYKSLYIFPHPLPPVFEGLGHFPWLQKFSYDAKISTETEASLLWDFIERHKDTLVELFVNQPPRVFDRSFQFPQLRSLDLGTCTGTSAEDILGITALLNSAPSLVVLKLPLQHPYSHDDALSILREAKSSNIKEMDIALQSLNPQILAILAKRLPNISDLHLRIDGYDDLSLQGGSGEERVRISFVRTYTDLC